MIERICFGDATDIELQSLRGFFIDEKAKVEA